MRRRYDPEFKLEAVRLVVEEGRKVRDVERSLGITIGVLKGWMAKYAVKKESACVKEAGPIIQSEAAAMDNFSRRDFLKISGLTVMAGALGSLGFNLTPIESYAGDLSIKTARQTTTICPYCAVGCGLIVHTDKNTGKVLDIEGDPDHPINEGSLCAKGAALYQLAENPSRISQVLYRAPNSDRWETKPWDWALDRIAANVKKSRDDSFVHKNNAGQVVNRTEGIAHVGSAALDNEECWLLQGMMRALGLVYIEHQARI